MADSVSSSNVLGHSGYYFFFGICEDRDDPLKIGRVRVRIQGLHTNDKSALPSSTLPWAQIALPTTSNDSSVPDIQVGVCVKGFFLDGADMQVPIIDAVIPGIIIDNGTYQVPNYRNLSDRTTSAYTDNDGRERKKAKNIPLEATDISEPADPFNAEYPKNRVRESETGHVFEMDDSSDGRIHVFHRNGSFLEFHPDSSIVFKTPGRRWDITIGDQFTFVKGDQQITIDSDQNVVIKNNKTEQALGHLTLKGYEGVDILSKKDIRLGAAGDIIIQGTNVSIDASAGINLTASGAISADGSAFNAQTGAAAKAATVPFGAEVSYVAPNYQAVLPDNIFVETDDDSDASTAAIEEAISNGAIKREDLVDNTTITQSDAKQGNTVGVESVDKVDPSAISPKLKLSKYFYLEDATTKTPAGTHKLAAQRGLTDAQIVDNLKFLLVNSIDKIKDKYPNLYLQSGFRRGNGKSQHEIGQAVDLRFKGVSNAEYYEIAKWIRDNVAYDQLLLEHLTTGTRIPWIHVSLKPTGNRKMVLTLLNHKTKSQGLAQLS